MHLRASFHFPALSGPQLLRAEVKPIPSFIYFFFLVSICPTFENSPFSTRYFTTLLIDERLYWSNRKRSNDNLPVLTFITNPKSL